jgi:hypothetical protein
MLPSEPDGWLAAGRPEGYVSKIGDARDSAGGGVACVF